MIYRSDTITRPDGSWPKIIYTYLSNFLDGLTFDENNQEVTFFNKFSFSTPTADSFYLNYLDKTVNLYTGWDTAGGPVTFTLILNDNLLLLSMEPYGHDGRVAISYVKDSQNNYYVGGVIFRGVVYSIYDFYYYNTSSSVGEYYTFPRVLNFTSTPGKILYSNKAVINNSNASTIIIPNVYSCSNVTRFSTVTILGDNYFAIETNNLFLIDE